MNTSKLEAAKKVIQDLRFDVEFFYPNRIEELKQELEQTFDTLSCVETELEEEEAEFKRKFGFIP